MTEMLLLTTEIKVILNTFKLTLVSVQHSDIHDPT